MELLIWLLTSLIFCLTSLAKALVSLISLVSFLAFPFFSCTRMFQPKKLARELKASSSKNCDVKLFIIPDLTKVLYIQKNCWAKTDLQQNLSFMPSFPTHPPPAVPFLFSPLPWFQESTSDSEFLWVIKMFILLKSHTDNTNWSWAKSLIAQTKCQWWSTTQSWQDCLYESNDAIGLADPSNWTLPPDMKAIP